MRSFITSTLRGGMRRYPPKWEVLADAFIGVQTNLSTGRPCKHYRCAKCKKAFPTKEVQVDHKKPVVDPKEGFVSWDVFIERLYCDKKNLQVLCSTCHKAKTAKEKEKRK